MASNTKNVKLGVCQVFFGGVDLGYTKGGVDVTVKTDTHKVEIDQFGKTPINEYIMGREVMVKVPLAETTLENLVAIMPGAVLTTDAIKASAVSGTVTGTFSALDAFTIGFQSGGVLNSTVFTFKAVPLTATDVASTGTLAQQLTALAAAITAASWVPVSAVASATTITITADQSGAAQNAYTLAKTSATATFTLPATLSGGTDPVVANVVVPTGIGVSLLAIAQRLILHPVSRAEGDTTEDFTVYLAATAGALNFAYKLENERIYSCEFNGYPDSNNGGRLFAIGNLGNG